MGDSSTSVGFKAKVTNITGLSFDADMRQNVKKRVAHIRYLHTPPEDRVLLAYVGTKELNANTALFIGDRSEKLYPNSRRESITEFIYYSSPVGVQHKNVLVTEKFATSTSSDIPLYYKHSLESTVSADSVKIFDRNFVEVSADHYLVELEKEYDEDTGSPVDPVSYTELAVYNSLKNWFNDQTGEYAVYYIQYTDQYDETHTVLLDNQLAYPEATIEDIWSATSDLAPWAKAYILEASGNSFYLRVPVGEKFAVQHTAEAKIYPRGPVLTNDVSLWLPRVANGAFSWFYGGAVQYSYTYEIAEFANQAFNPIEPYKYTDRAQAQRISPHLVKLAHTELGRGELMGYFSLLIEHQGEVQHALTEDPDLVGSLYKNIDGQYVTDPTGGYVAWSSGEILSIDKYTGMVHLSLELKDYWDYYANYNYKEKFFEVSYLNMNPVFDREAHKQVRVLYLVPKSFTNYNSGTQTESIRYLKVTPGGIIEDTNQDGNGGNTNQDFDTQVADDEAYGIVGILDLHYSWRASTYLTADSTLSAGSTVFVETTNKFPRSGWVRIYDGSYWRYVKYIDKTETTLILSSDATQLPASPVAITYEVDSSKLVEMVNFIDEHTTLTNRNATDEDTSYGGTGRPNCYHQYFILAEMALNPPHGIKDAEIIDLRENGGGILPDKYEEAKLIQPEAQWFFDYMKYDGQPHPGNATVVVKIPIKLLETFTEEQIAAIVDDNIPYGVKPLIRYYGYTPEVTAITPLEG